MTFIIIVVSLLIERFFHWGHLRAWRWLEIYLQKLQASRFAASPVLMHILVLLPPLLLIGVIQFLLAGKLYNVPSLIFGIIVLLYCLGPANFWAHFHAHKDAPELFALVHERIFAVIFWFGLLGPVGAVLYRVVALADFSKLRAWLDWLPVRVFTFIFALAGHFAEVFTIWKQNVLRGPAVNEKLLTECGMAALAEERGENAALAFLDRVLVIAVVILAILVLLL